ncbi:hypothetical protein [Mycobacterium sp. 1245499.0]|uniref:hypothetical protein n=1 Tax=Mycobacterium sp. 1245499.0 TaxID=1834074 RepID=UPI0009F576C1|nr:hypothetical protein [Mycobacterium sp. 1245499.0]
MKLTTVDGYEVEVDLRFGFTVHNQDGSSSRIVHLENPRVIGGPPDDGGPGEPLPKRKAS